MDVTAVVSAAISAWLAQVARDIWAPALDAVGALLFSTPAFDRVTVVATTWAVVRNVCDALFVLAWLGAGLLVMTSGGAESRYTAKTLVPRLAFAAVLANASLAICGALIGLNNALIAAVLGDARAARVLDAIGRSVSEGQLGTQLLGILVALVAALFALALVAVVVGRNALLVLLIVLAPLALAAHALPQTEELAALWWRAFTGLLFVQVLQALLIGVGLGILANAAILGDAAAGLVSAVFVLALLYLLLRLPFAVFAWALRRSVSPAAFVRMLATVPVR